MFPSSESSATEIKTQYQSMFSVTEVMVRIQYENVYLMESVWTFKNSLKLLSLF